MMLDGGQAQRDALPPLFEVEAIFIAFVLDRDLDPHLFMARLGILSGNPNGCATHARQRKVIQREMHGLGIELMASGSP